MNNLIDCHELSSVANMDVEQDSDEETHQPRQQRPYQDQTGEYDEGRMHAGTGGSSKMKQRPGMAGQPSINQ